MQLQLQLQKLPIATSTHKSRIPSHADMGKSNLSDTANVQFYKSVVAGSVSGLTVRFIISPLDVLKIRLQLKRNSPTSHLKAISAWSTIKSVVADEGFFAFWKGNLPAEIMYLVYGGVQFSSYSFLKQHLTAFSQQQQQQQSRLFNSNFNPFANREFISLVSGGVSGCLATVTSYPFDTLRTRLAADKTRGFNKLMHTIITIYRTETIKGFYEGLAPTIYQVFINTGISFWSYGKLREYQEHYQLKKDSLFIPVSGFLAGAFGKGVTFPLDSIKRRLQIKGSGNLRAMADYQYLVLDSALYNSKNLIKIAARIFQVEGILGFYRGFGIAIVKSAPASSLSFTFYELCMHYLH